MRLSGPKRALTRIASLLGVAAGAGCGAEELPPLAEVVLFVDTDAPLPPPGGQLADPDEPPALFDTARVDVFGPKGDCAPCSHEFSVDQERIGAGASLGILPRSGRAGYLVRVRLFRVALLVENEPRPDSTIDVTVALPEVVDGQIDEVTVLLPTDSVGQRLGSFEAPVQPEKGRPTKPRVGTWPGAQRVPCAGAPAQDEVCVPGGAYWMGNPSLTTAQLTEPADRQRLVVVSPFFVDATEVTVARFRGSGLAVLDDPATRPSGATGAHLEDWCTYTETAGDTDALPVNCVSWGKAREYCVSTGKDLVTEAQHEYVAGALRSWDFVWGRDAPSCAEAVFGRGGYGVLEPVLAPCKPSSAFPGPLPAGSGARDALTLPTGTVLDLAGNLSEHTLDLWNSQDEPCWSAGLLYDPLCTQPGALGATHASRGGAWVMLGRRLVAAGRISLEEGGVAPFVGFRCARPGG